MVTMREKKLLTDAEIADIRAQIAEEEAEDGLIEWSSSEIIELLDHIDILEAKLAEKK